MPDPADEKKYSDNDLAALRLFPVQKARLALRLWQERHGTKDAGGGPQRPSKGRIARNAGVSLTTAHRAIRESYAPQERPEV